MGKKPTLEEALWVFVAPGAVILVSLSIFVPDIPQLMRSISFCASAILMVVSSLAFGYLFGLRGIRSTIGGVFMVLNAILVLAILVAANSDKAFSIGFLQFLSLYSALSCAGGIYLGATSKD